MLVYWSVCQVYPTPGSDCSCRIPTMPRVPSGWCVVSGWIVPNEGGTVQQTTHFMVQKICYRCIALLGLFVSTVDSFWCFSCTMTCCHDFIDLVSCMLPAIHTTTKKRQKIHVPWGDCCERLSHDWQIVGPSQSTLGLLQVRDPVPCRHLHWPLFCFFSWWNFSGDVSGWNHTQTLNVCVFFKPTCG